MPQSATLAQVFVATDPRFVFFLLHEQEIENDEPVEVTGEIIPQPDVAGLRAYASLGEYARRQASYAD